MEFAFSQLKQKDVISLTDGRNLGRVCDISFIFPENKLTGISVTGGRGFRFTRQDMFIPISCVEKIGDDAVLVRIESPHDKPPQCPPKRDNCPPPKRPPCPPKCPPNPCPPDRRSYDEYE